MRILDLVIVDDEPILLQGLLETYEWEKMGFRVVGTAQNGEQALQVIREKKPHVVLTDIRMKQMTGLQVMEEINKDMENECLFIILSAYKDFEYAQQACELGAFAYLLKPIEDDKLQETMEHAYQACMEQIENDMKYENWEKFLLKDSNSFLQVVIQKYLQNRISGEKLEEVFQSIGGGKITGNDRFVVTYVDVDLTYKIVNSLEYEAARFSLLQRAVEKLKNRFFFWNFESEDGHAVFLIQADENSVVRDIKEIMESLKKEQKYPVVAAISKPYKGIRGIKRAYDECKQLFEVASVSGATSFTSPEELDEKMEKGYSVDAELLIINAVRKNDSAELRKAFANFVYTLPSEPEKQNNYMHKLMLQTEFMIQDSYGMTEQMKEKFQSYYSNMRSLSAEKAVDVCYKILDYAIEVRSQESDKTDSKYFKEYLSAAVAYIDAHLNDEDLSIVSVATHIYLNPVYFGRVFKNTFHMTFKKYLLQRRMEKAKILLQNGKISVGAICEEVGISNPSYFAHLFKEYTGKLPSEYKKEFE